MRTLVDIGEKEMVALDQLARKERVSRAALIRRAVDDLLAKQRNENRTDAFGLWDNRAGDGLAYQEKLREEW